MASNIFSNVTGKNDELKNLLLDAINALDNADMGITKIVIESAPSAFEKGLTDDKDAYFFGFAFKKGSKVITSTTKRIADDKTETTVKVINKIEEKPKPKFFADAPEKSDIISVAQCSRKMSDREAESYKIGLDYVCPCGFKTQSSKGFKKHINKCDKVKYVNDKYVKKE